MGRIMSIFVDVRQTTTKVCCPHSGTNGMRCPSHYTQPTACVTKYGKLHDGYKILLYSYTD